MPNNTTYKMSMLLTVKRIQSDAILPTRGSPYAAGADLYAAEDATISQLTRQLISTGISVEIKNHGPIPGGNPADYYLRIAPRSGLAVKNWIDIAAGVVDSDYRGEVRVCVVNNHPTNTFVIKKGDRIAQMIMERCNLFSIEETVDELSDTKRGTGGFGSTDVVVVSNPPGHTRCWFCEGPVGNNDLCEQCSKKQKDVADAEWIPGYAGCGGQWVGGYWADHDHEDVADAEWIPGYAGYGDIFDHESTW